MDDFSLNSIVQTVYPSAVEIGDPSCTAFIGSNIACFVTTIKHLLKKRLALKYCSYYKMLTHLLMLLSYYTYTPVHIHVWHRL